MESIKRKTKLLSAATILFIAVAAPTLAVSMGTTTPLGLPSLVIPANNPQTPQKIALGKALFMDKRLSRDGAISCSSCHDPNLAFTDGRPLARGFQRLQGGRNTPTIINAAYLSTQFWDGRRISLEDQVRDPLVNPLEHALSDDEEILAIVRNDSEYVSDFNDVFLIQPADISIDHIAQAIAAYERTLIYANTPFDRYFYGGEKTAMSESATRGFEIFRGIARCHSCHVIEKDHALFTDNEFHRLGVGYKRIEPNLAKLVSRADEQKGRAFLSDPELAELGRFLVTLNPVDIGKFKTPTLRNVALTAPYMHDGSIPTLEQAVEYEVYYRGVESGRPLILTPQEKGDLVEFLMALTSPEVPYLMNLQQKAVLH